ncbi:MAG: hypothetical protein WD887_01795 [Candidatus Saccharimonadales bacterium]
MEANRAGLDDDGIIIPHNRLGSKNENIAFGAVAAFSLARFSPLLGGPEVRDVLPEPVDVFNHIGNLSVSFVLANHMAHSYWGTGLKLAAPERFKRQRNVIAAVIGGIALAANAYAEKYGYGPVSTPDPLDFVYGCIGGYLGYKVGLPRYIRPDLVNEIVENSPEDSRSRKVVLNLKEEKAERIAGAKANRAKAPSSKLRPNDSSVPKKGGGKKKKVRKQQRQSRQRNR